MEVTAGYQQTELGVIPNDWNIDTISSVSKLINGRGFKPFEWRTDGLPIIRIQNLNGSDDFNYYQGTYDAKIEVESGQLLFAWSGSRGTSFGPHIWHGPFALLNYHTWKIVINESRIDRLFYLYALRKLTYFIENSAHGASALVHTQKWEMEGFKFPIPQSTKEQQAIGIALSDADALIESLEQLITKKRQIKQGAMQELLTGKRRLPGFEVKPGYKQTELGLIPEDWKISTIGQNSTWSSGGTPARGNDEYWSGDIPWISGSTLKSLEISTSDQFLTTEGVAAGSKMAPLTSTLLLVRGSALHNEIRAGLVVSPVSFNQDVKALTPSKSVFPKYLTLYILGVADKLLQLVSSAGNSAGVLDTKLVQNFIFALPLIEEQKAIESALSDIDVELALLGEKLIKVQQIKQGMMQELLTGRIRLI
jgi:type I restriction enzyme S subunit